MAIATSLQLDDEPQPVEGAATSLVLDDDAPLQSQGNVATSLERDDSASRLDDLTFVPGDTDQAYEQWKEWLETQEKQSFGMDDAIEIGKTMFGELYDGGKAFAANLAEGEFQKIVNSIGEGALRGTADLGILYQKGVDRLTRDEAMTRERFRGWREIRKLEAMREKARLGEEDLIDHLAGYGALEGLQTDDVDVDPALAEGASYVTDIGTVVGGATSGLVRKGAGKQIARLEGKALRGAGKMVGKAGEVFGRRVFDPIADNLAERFPNAADQYRQLKNVATIAGASRNIPGSVGGRIALEAAERIGPAGSVLTKSIDELPEFPTNMGPLERNSKNMALPEGARKAAGRASRMGGDAALSLAKDVGRSAAYGSAAGAVLGGFAEGTEGAKAGALAAGLTGGLGGLGGRAIDTITGQRDAAKMQGSINDFVSRHQGDKEALAMLVDMSNLEVVDKASGNLRASSRKALENLATASEMLRGRVDIKVLSGEEFAKMTKGRGVDGFYDSQSKEIVVNADSKNPGDTVLHEVGEAMWDSGLVDTRTVRNQVAREYNLDELKKSYAEQMLKAEKRGKPTDDEITQRVRELDRQFLNDGDQDWVVREMFAENFMSVSTGQGLHNYVRNNSKLGKLKVAVQRAAAPLGQTVGTGLTQAWTEAKGTALSMLDVMKGGEGMDGLGFLKKPKDGADNIFNIDIDPKSDLSKSYKKYAQNLNRQYQALEQGKEKITKLNKDSTDDGVNWDGVGKEYFDDVPDTPPSKGKGPQDSDSGSKGEGKKGTRKKAKNKKELKKRARQRRKEVKQSLEPELTESSVPEVTLKPKYDDAGNVKKGLNEYRGKFLQSKYSDAPMMENFRGTIDEVNQAIADGRPIRSYYFGIGTRSLGDDTWLNSLTRNSGDIPATEVDYIPHEWFITNNGNVNVRVIDLNYVRGRVNAWRDTKKLEPWNNDVDAFLEDAKKYLDNHRNNISGEEGLTTKQHNIINALFQANNKTINPLYTAWDKNSGNRIYKNLRIERIASLRDTSANGTPFGMGPFDHLKAKQMFSPTRASSPEMDSAHAKAVNSGDTESAQRMVQEAASKAGYNFGPLYHGTWQKDEVLKGRKFVKREPFNSFKIQKRGSTNTPINQWGVFLTPNKQGAEVYADFAGRNKAGGERRIVNAMVKMENPYTAEFKVVGRQFLDYGSMDNQVYKTKTQASKAAREFKQDLVDKGHDGIILTDNDGKPYEVIVFDPAQIKSADPATYDKNGNLIPLSERFKETTADIRFSPARQLDDLGMYSKAQEAIEGMQQKKGTSQQFLKAMDKAGVKKEELEDIGLDVFLKDNPTTTKEDVLNFIKANQIEMVEVTEKSDKGVAYIIHDSSNSGVFSTDIYSSKEEADRFRLSTYQLGGFDPESGSGPSYEEWSRRYPIVEDEFQSQNNTKYSEYTEPGAEPGTYTERLLTLPDPEEKLREELRHAHWQLGHVKHRTPEQEAEFQALGRKIFGPKKDPRFGPYTSGHFDEANIIAHVRHNDRIGPDGEKILFLEEIQSDWHQEGRERGYAPRDHARIQREYDELWKSYEPGAYERWVEKFTEYEMQRDRLLSWQPENESEAEAKAKMLEVFEVELPKDVAEGRRLSEQRDRLEGLAEALNKMGVTPAPFKKSWPEFSMKRMLKLAADEGYDAIAWTTGETQNARYDLGDKVSGLQVNEFDGGQYELMARVPDEDIFKVIDSNMTREKLQQTIGKELTKRALDNMEGPEGVRSALLEGDDLRLGGKGMRGFYDEMLPRLKLWKQTKDSKGKPLQVQQKTLQGDLRANYVALNEDVNSKVSGQGVPRYSVKRGDLWKTPKSQEYTSAETSINRTKTPATFGRVKWERGTINADIGGGRFDNATNFLAKKGVKNYIFDPFNRSQEHNDRVTNTIADGGADTATVNNVLNVIKEPGNRHKVIAQAADAIKLDGEAYFLIYEGNRSGKGGPTKAGYQNNLNAKSYVKEISRYFGNVTQRGNLLVATKPKKADADNLPGFNVKSEPDMPFADLILSGRKTIETRAKPTLNSLVGRRVKLIETTGKGSGKVKGEVTVGEPKFYKTKAEFDADIDKHLVQDNSEFAFGPGGKWGYPMEDPVIYQEPYETNTVLDKPKGRVLTKSVPGRRFSPSRVSNAQNHLRVGTSRSDAVNAKEPLQTDNISGEIVPVELMQKHLAKMDYDHVPASIKSIKDLGAKREAYIDWISGNLLALHDAFPADLRETATLWYDGANNIANNFSATYNYKPEQSAGVLAVLSPQKNWFMNVAQAEQVMDIWKHHRDTVLTEEIIGQQFNEVVQAAQATPSAKKKAKVGETPLAKKRRTNFNKKQDQIAIDKRRKLLSPIIGSTINQLAYDKELQGWAIRVLAQSIHGREYRVINPDGTPMQIDVKKDGKSQKNGWGSIPEIVKAVSILEDGSMGNISKQLGGEHKVRNFFNNIIAPNSSFGDATIDTHAVAAGHLMPYGANSTPVSHNFGTGVSKSKAKGISGTYHIYLDAYKRAAKARGLLPRQMQSITWEAVRLLYPPESRRDKTVIDNANNIWKNNSDGNARKQIVGGTLPAPSWAGTLDGRKPQAVPEGLPQKGVQDDSGGGLLFRGGGHLDIRPGRRKRFSPVRQLNNRGGAIYRDGYGFRAVQTSSRAGVRIYSNKGRRVGPVFNSVEKAQDHLDKLRNN